MISNTNIFKALGMAAATVLSLAACESTPTAMPAGYAYHQGEYKAPPGAKPQSIGYEWSVQQSAESAAHWRIAAEDIVKRIVARSGVSSVPIYVEPGRARTPFVNTFDNFLREELIDAGFVLAATSGKGPVLRYDAQVVEHENDAASEVETTDTSDYVRVGEKEEPVPLLPSSESEVVITANITGGGRVLAEVTGVYYVPEAASYNYREPVIRSLPVIGKR